VDLCGVTGGGRKRAPSAEIIFRERWNAINGFVERVFDAAPTFQRPITVAVRHALALALVRSAVCQCGFARVSVVGEC
jgi:hypothetical protein